MKDGALISAVLSGTNGIAPIKSARNHAAITGVKEGDALFRKPHDNAGEKTFPESQGGYSAYANQFVYDVTFLNPIINTSSNGAKGHNIDTNEELGGGFFGRVFYGQRKDAFKIALGKVFDLLNINPVVGDGNDDVEDALAKNNVTSWVMEVDINDIAQGKVIGAWATRGRVVRELVLDEDGKVKIDDDGKAEKGSIIGLQQKSRMGNPLVNELVIGTKDKDRFNQASHPSTDAQTTMPFGPPNYIVDYVQAPSFPAILEAVFPTTTAPVFFPRTDLQVALLTGFTLTDPTGNVLLSNRTGGPQSDMLRIDLSVAPTPPAAQSSLGVLSLDLAGFPNGRRPGDDVVDIVTRVSMGVLCHIAPNVFGCPPGMAPLQNAPSGNLALGDGVATTPQVYTAFPFLETPVPGSKI